MWYDAPDLVYPDMGEKNPKFILHVTIHCNR